MTGLLQVLKRHLPGLVGSQCHVGSCELGMGPREEPSQLLQPMEQPFENQKQACPFFPLGFPSFPVTGHQLKTQEL